MSKHYALPITLTIDDTITITLEQADGGVRVVKARNRFGEDVLERIKISNDKTIEDYEHKSVHSTKQKENSSN